MFMLTHAPFPTLERSWSGSGRILQCFAQLSRFCGVTLTNGWSGVNTTGSVLFMPVGHRLRNSGTSNQTAELCYKHFDYLSNDWIYCNSEQITAQNWLSGSLELVLCTLQHHAYGSCCFWSA